MKKLTSVIIGCVIISNLQAAKLPTRQSMLTSSLTQYQGILGAWFINQKCQFIDDKASKSLEKDLATIASKLRKDMGDSKRLTLVLSEAKKIPEQENIARCETEAKKQFNSGVEQAKVWSNNIRNHQPNTPKNLKVLPEAAYQY